MVDIEVSSLEEIKNALSQFMSEIQGTADSVARTHEKNSTRVKSAMTRETQVQHKIELELANLKAKVDKQERETDNIERKLQQIKNQKSSLQSELDSIPPDDEENSYEAQRNNLQSQIDEMRRKERQAEEELLKSKKELENLNVQKGEKEQQLTKQQDKIERLTVYFKKIEKDGEQIINSIGNLEGEAILTGDKGANCVSKCIQYLNEYLSS